MRFALTALALVVTAAWPASGDQVLDDGGVIMVGFLRQGEVDTTAENWPPQACLTVISPVVALVTFVPSSPTDIVRVKFPNQDVQTMTAAHPFATRFPFKPDSCRLDAELTGVSIASRVVYAFLEPTSPPA